MFPQAGYLFLGLRELLFGHQPLAVVGKLHL